MSYERINWEDTPSTKTPINAENLNKMDQGIFSAHEQLDAIPDWAKEEKKPSYTPEDIGSYTKEEIDVLKANSIISKASGEVVTTTDSAKAKPKNIKLFGKTEQDSTEGNQLFDLFTSSGMDSTLSDDGLTVTSISVTGSSYVNLLNANFNTVQLLSGKSCYISFDIKLASGSLEKINDVKLMINSEVVAENCSKVIVPTLNSSYQRYVVQVTVDSDVEFTTLFLQGYNATNAVVEITKFMIAESTYEWEPYTGGERSPNMNYPQPLNSHGDSGSIVGKVLSGNVLKYSYPIGHTETKNGITFTILDDGGINVVGTNTTDSEVNLQLLKRGDYSVTDGKYTLFVKGCNNNVRLQMWNNWKPFFEGASISVYTDTYTISGACVDLVPHGGIYVKPNASVNTTVYIALNHGTEALPYEPYTEQPFTVLTPNGLLGLPVSMGGNHVDSDGQKRMVNIKDYGIGKNIERIYRLRMSAALAWTYYETTNNKNHNFKLHLTDNGFPRGIQWTTVESYAYLMATKFTHFRVVDVAWDNTGFGESKAYVSDTTLVISFSADSEINSLEAFKQFLDDNEVYAYYILAEPIITDLTQEELDQYNALLMNYPNTTVVNDAGAYMEVEYVADTKCYIDNKFKELQTALANTNAQLL